MGKDQGVELKEIPGNGLTDLGTQRMIDRQLEKRKQEEILGSDKLSFRQKVLAFGTGFITGLTDPINVAAGMIPVGKLLGISGEAGANFISRTAGRAAVGFAEGAIGTAAQEAAVNYPLAQELNDDYTVWSALQNTFYGGMFGAALHAGAGAIGEANARFFPKKGGLPNMPPPDGGLPPKTEPSLEGGRVNVEPPSQGTPEPQLTGAAKQMEALGFDTHLAATETALSHMLQGKHVDVNPLVEAEQFKVLHKLEETTLELRSEMENPKVTEESIREILLERRKIEDRLGVEEPKEGYTRSEFDPEKFADKAEAADTLKAELSRLSEDPNQTVKVNHQNVEYRVDKGGVARDFVALLEEKGYLVKMARYSDLVKDPTLKVEYADKKYAGGPQTTKIVEDFNTHLRDGPTDQNINPIDSIQERLEAKIQEPAEAIHIDEASERAVAQTLEEASSLGEKAEPISEINRQILELTDDFNQLSKDMSLDVKLEEIPDVKAADMELKQAREYALKMKALANCNIRKGSY